MARTATSTKTVARQKPAKARRAADASPIGSTSEEAASRRAARSPEYRAQKAEREGLREIAWLLIKYRMDRGLSQERLAELVGTSHSQISRIESGRHRTNLETLSRIAHALNLRMVLGFESTTSSGRAKRDLVTF
jgi:ribosome-binding protein aMBF1 (putative translation factor)